MFLFLTVIFSSGSYIELFWPIERYSSWGMYRVHDELLVTHKLVELCAHHLISIYLAWIWFINEKPRVRRSSSAFLRIPDFESQKFFRFIKIPVFSFLTFSYFEPLIFLKCYTKNTSWTIIFDFWSKELSFYIKCWWIWYPTE